MFPSLESAVTELGLLLIDREQELGGTKSILFYGAQQDPAFDSVAKILSGVGLDARPLNEVELLTSQTWLKAEGSSALFLAVTESDRFNGKFHDLAALRANRLSLAAKTPLLVLSAESFASGFKKPEPQEILIHEIFLGNGSSVAVAFIGDRLRFEPRLAPISFSTADLEATIQFIEALPNAFDPASLEAASTKNRTEIETFESALPRAYQAYWPKGSQRLLDRVIFTSKDHDGSWTTDRIIKILTAKGVDEMIAKRGLFTLSGCAMGDERRQEWLRARGDDELKIRGLVHVSLELIHATPTAVLLEALKI